MSSPSAGINHVEVDRSAAESEYAEEDGTGTADGFPVLTNRGNVNKNGIRD